LNESQARYSTRTGPSLTATHAHPGTSRATLGAISATPSPRCTRPATSAPVAVCNGARLMLKVEIDKAAETARLSKEAEKLQKALDKLNAKLSKPGYTEKAPAHLVEKDKADLAELEDKMAKVQNQLAKLKD